jgi:hypothetical protein
MGPNVFVAKGADVEFWTNEEPRSSTNSTSTTSSPIVDGERAMGWVSDRFNGQPTTPNCQQI